jgi:hypothetical protein
MSTSCTKNVSPDRSTYEKRRERKLTVQSTRFLVIEVAEVAWKIC